MKTLKFLLLFLMIFLNTGIIQSQTNQALMNKYWTYRQRFLGDWYNRDENPGFVKIGLGNGQSTPVVIRDKFKNNDYLTIDHFDPNNTDPYCYIEGVSLHKPDGSHRDTVWGSLQFGDGTITHGVYLAVLGLEWKLLNINGQDTRNTEEELWFALEAIDRLDFNAETLYPDENHPGQNLAGKVNGFFIRGDGETELSQYFGKDYKMVWSGKSMVDFNKKCDKHSDPKYVVKDIQSQDQAIGLLFGLSFIKKMVNENTSVLGEKLVEKAAEITHRIMNILQANGPADWKIKDPYGDKVCRGPRTLSFSWALAKIGNFITGKNYQNPFSLEIGLRCWNVIKYNSHVSPGEYFSVSEVLLPLFIDANWQWDNIPWTHNMNMVLQLYSIVGQSIDHYDIAINSYMLKKDIYDLAYAALHNCEAKGPGHFNNLGVFEPDFTQAELKAYWENQILGTAPCKGPCYDNHEGVYSGSDCSDPVECWWNDYRWADTDHASWSETYGEYNGLDFMLAYNLYRYVFDKYGYIKMSGVFVQPMEITTSPNTIVSPNKITSKTTIQANGTNVVKYIAGKEIDLLPGFNTQENAFFEAYTENSLQCDQNKLSETKQFNVYDILPYQVRENPVEKKEESPNEILNEESCFEVYPNPCSNKINVFISNSKDQEYSVQIINTTGMVVWQKKNITFPSPEFDINGISSGIYYIKLFNQSSNFTKKIIIQN
jgi:hypothetical protein